MVDTRILHLVHETKLGVGRDRSRNRAMYAPRCHMVARDVSLEISYHSSMYCLEILDR